MTTKTKISDELRQVFDNLSKEYAMDHVFDMESGDLNKDVIEKHSKVAVFDALVELGSLSITLNDDAFDVKPYIETHETDETTIEELCSLKERFNDGMLTAYHKS